MWLLAGTMALMHGGETWRLDAGDCLAMRVDGPVEFRNPTRRAARYAVVIANEAARVVRR
ncbi:MAG: cupin domain-containing protein [Rhizobiales bacterium]|nr:cupin domain-containing protein [Rhizobacter sp.]